MPPRPVAVERLPAYSPQAPPAVNWRCKLSANHVETIGQPSMRYIVGLDEAGYGPNLGPLIVAATVWEVPPHTDEDGLYSLLADAIVPSAGRAAGGSGRVAMADSKCLYQSGGGLRNLERGVLGALRTLGAEVDLWSEVWDALVPDSLAALARIPWYADFDEPAPVHAPPEELASVSVCLSAAFAASGARLRKITADAVFPDRFNDLLLLHDTKGAALSHLSLQLAAQTIAELGDGAIAIVCDKHGGRNRYGRLLEEYFPDWLVENHGESRERSVYRFGPAQRRISATFRARAEICLPVALASMTAKYLRELAMRALNAFWYARVPGLKPTAGYPADAPRFHHDIAEARQTLGIPDHIFWRNR